MKWPSASPLPYLSPSITSSIRDSACAKLDEERDKALFRIASSLSESNGARVALGTALFFDATPEPRHL